MRVTCVGAGPAGLYAAILMKVRHPSNEVTVWERGAEGQGYGWGVVFWDDLRECLHRNDPVSAVRIDEAALRWEDLVVDLKGVTVTEPGSGYSITRKSLLAILAKRADEVGVCLEFTRQVAGWGDIPEGDLIVAADGVNSALRCGNPAFGTTEHVGRNKYVWLGTTKVFGSFTFPFVLTEHGWIWAHAYGCCSDSSTVVVECSPETWAGLGFDGLPVAESLALLEELFGCHLAGGHLMVQGSGLTTLPWANFRRITNEHWHADQVVLIGDAAHTTHFTIGSGTRLAMEDAIALTDHLDGASEISAALDGYEAERKEAIASAQSDADLSEAWFEDVEIYAELKPRRFVTLLHARRSPLVAEKYGSRRKVS